MEAAQRVGADLVLMDLGPSLSPLNRAALVASDCVVVPVAADLFSVRGLINLGPRLHDWRNGWKRRLENPPDDKPDLPKGDMRPVGYIVLSYATRNRRPTRAYARWSVRIPEVFAQSVLQAPGAPPRSLNEDPHRLATMRNYLSLMPMAQEARKPVFRLRSSDGALGAHGVAVTRAHREFEELARSIARACGVPLPTV